MEEAIELITSIYSQMMNRHQNYLHFFSSLSWYQIYVLCLTISLSINAHCSRYFLPYLYAENSSDSFHSLSVSTNISSFGYGNLIGYGFSLSFVFFSLWVARLAHYHSPKRLLLFGIITWNISIWMVSNATTFDKLMGSRIILGLGSAFCSPICYNLLIHFFPSDDSHPILFSLFGYGSYIGMSLSSWLYLFIEENGWKECCSYLYSSGFALTMLLLFTLPAIPKPPRGKYKKEIKPALYTIEDTYREIKRNNALLLLLLIGSLRFMIDYILTSYIPLFYSNKYPKQFDSICIIQSIIILVIGGVVMVFQSAVSGVLTLDRPGCVYGSCSYLMILSISSLCAIPTLLLTFLSPSLPLSLIGLFLSYLLTDWWFRPFIFIFQRELSPSVRNIALGFLTALTSFSGSAATTVVGYYIGKRDDNLHGNIHTPPKNVTVTLCWASSVILGLSAFLFGVVYIMIIQDAHKVEARIRRKIGQEAGNRTGNNSSHPKGEGEGDEEGESLLGTIERCEKEIDIELQENEKDEKDELDETNERKEESER